jgi:hypothetical protein
MPAHAIGDYPQNPSRFEDVIVRRDDERGAIFIALPHGARVAAKRADNRTAADGEIVMLRGAAFKIRHVSPRIARDPVCVG